MFWVIVRVTTETVLMAHKLWVVRGCRLTSQSWRLRLSLLSSSVNLIAIFRQVIAKSLISRFLILRAPMVRSSSENAKQKVSHDNWSDWLKSVFRKRADSEFFQKGSIRSFSGNGLIQSFFSKTWILGKSLINEFLENNLKLTQVWEYMYIHHPYPAGWRIPVLRDHFEFVNSILDRRWENLSILLDVDSKLISTAEPFSS